MPLRWMIPAFVPVALGCMDGADAPLRHVNPKGFVDAWRTPKYFHYLWQALYAKKLR